MKKKQLNPHTSPQNVRMDSDSLGQISLPAEALYGPETQRAVENFPISDVRAPRSLTASFLKVKWACAAANVACGVLSREEFNLIRKSIQYLLDHPEHWSRWFPVDVFQAGAGTSQNMNVNEVIANQANLAVKMALGSFSPIDPHRHVNASQSTNDIYPTVMRIAVLDVSTELVDQLNLFADAFEERARAFQGILKAARTHLQDAVPIPLSREWDAYALTLRKCADRIEAVRTQELMEVGIGGSAAGTALNVPENYLEHVFPALKRLTGFELRPARHLGEAMQSQAPLYAYASVLKLVCLELTRIANDLRLMASGPFTGLGEIRLPAAQPGSSMMPGKVNPSLLEMLHQVCFRVIGSADTVAWSVAAGQFELNVMMPVMAYANLESTSILTQALETVRTRCIFGIEPRRRRLQSYFESTAQVATALTPVLGYDRVAEAVKLSEQEGVPVLQWIESKGWLNAEEIRKRVNVEKFIQEP